MDKTYLAINLNDFHKNQKTGEAGTITEIRFIAAKDIDEAKRTIHNLRPNEAWGVVLKSNMDKNIAYCNI